jgi:ADP-heptose:LPS heptosyltransferase
LLRALRPRQQRHQAQTILLLQQQIPLGCCVHCTPLFSAIKQARPGCTLVVAARGLASATFQHDPHIDHLIETSDPAASRMAILQSASALRRELKQRNLQPDLILQDSSNRAGTYALFAALLRLAPTAGFANAPELYDTHLDYDTQRSLIANNLRLVELLGAPPKPIEPAVYFTGDELTAAEAMLREANPEGRRVAAFVMQGSGGQRTSWHDDRFAQVLRNIEDRGYASVFLGTTSDADVINRIAHRASSRGLSLAGRTTIPQLSALLTQCDLLVSVDTGTMHVGRAAGLPMVVLGPSWQRPVEWLPIGLPNVRILRGADRDGVPPGYQLDEIEVPAVLAAVDDLIARYPASAADRAGRATRLLSGTRP